MSLESTSKFKVEKILYQSPKFAIASGYWDGGSKLGLACRWYADGIGYPQTYGKPQWMNLPAEVSVEVKDLLNPSRSEVVLHFPPIAEPKIFFHTRGKGEAYPENVPMALSAFVRLPEVGEEITLGTGAHDLHRVERVVHVGFPADYIAEVFCERVE
jgi:hypothetical protein